MKTWYLLLFTCQLQAAVNPLSKIDITSKNAVFSRDDQEITKILYKGGVTVKLADNSTIKSKTLEILIDKPTEEQQVNFKKIVFEGSVRLKQNNRNAQADQIKLLPVKKQCKLVGNVKIEQTKDKDDDIPLITKSNAAIIDLNTSTVSLLGDQGKPVQTTIVIGDHPMLKQMKQKK